MQQRSLDLALELERTNRARVDVGQSPPLDLVAARAEVAQRRENLIVARTAALQAEDHAADADRRSEARRLLDACGSSRPTRRRRSARRPTSTRRSAARWRERHRHRAGTQADRRTPTPASRSRRTRRCPTCGLQATYLTNGARRTRLLRTGGFPGTIVGSEDTSFGSVLGQVLTADYPTWTVGVTFSYPLGQERRAGDLARARIERDQANARLRSLELAAVREVRDAALRLEQNRQRIETTRLGRELAEQRLDAEQKRFEVGMSTSFLVIQAQRDLAIARNNELQALLDYQLVVGHFRDRAADGTSSTNQLVNAVSSGTGR